MKRINIVVEGQAEETYINEVLSIHLAQFDVGAVARRVSSSVEGNSASFPVADCLTTQN
ncbi:MAG: hypothetical protein HW390_1971 [Candidatus Brocadiaceae bacterium]|nr:hypothetical protein [Candidatus Brocadiaceae bacterium]